MTFNLKTTKYGQPFFFAQIFPLLDLETEIALEH